MNINVGDLIYIREGNYIRAVEVRPGRLGGLICKCFLADGCFAYYKTGRDLARHDILAETSRLTWLQGKLPVPSVLDSGCSNENAWLLISAVPGLPSHLSKIDPRELIGLLAQGLRKIHSISSNDCQFDKALDEELDECLRRIRCSELDVAAFMKGTGGLTPHQTIDQLFHDRSQFTNLVFTHGDYGLSNVILNGTNLEGIIDWGIAGLADAHRDLMTISDSIVRYLGERWVDQFYDAYGAVKVDQERVRYFTLLDQFFLPTIWIPGHRYHSRDQSKV
jgi:aminoglycoside 3'-phosphotransferase-1